MSSARLALGGNGPIFLSGTSPSPVGAYYVLQAGGGGCTINSIAGLAGFSGATLAPGDKLMFGSVNVTQATLTSGTAFLYKR